MPAMKPVRILIVEDSPRLLPMFVEQAIKTFAGVDYSLANKKLEEQYEYPGVVIHHCHTLKEARELLSTHDFNGAVIDIGFPTDNITERLTGNRNGLILLGEIRTGALKRNQKIPVAVTSVEHVHDKIKEFVAKFPENLPRESLYNVRGFFKGEAKEGMGHMNVQNTTIPAFERRGFSHNNVAEDPLSFLKEKIYPQIESHKEYRGTNRSAFLSRVFSLGSVGR